MHTTLSRKHRLLQSKRANPPTNTKSIQTNSAKSKSNQRFVQGLAELLGQFGPGELQAHRLGLVALLNEIIESTGAACGPLDSDTKVVVLQRVAGQLANQASR